jgi:hypothetical protein
VAVISAIVRHPTSIFINAELGNLGIEGLKDKINQLK